ncbi:glutamate-ammonia-ligase adenylyltransferase [Frondihabitans sp. PhB188]|uniref:bifunctional [glutamine synthetase] adenylyltransferase/[glutamine synthetase]-adenylyl-L-tyrosine phosphorylase n=1 Tax=Frondihabitans sp. PhB188 TaxID=2485200 RepID=UPI000F4667D9|nr:bifunctional [glutamine synthetase] adenylyltransferase/[glutamine synthetase]-adenylyl-L-tyrosine phosphorylase [Frondihabitans sp. PhB188]ROQ41138.1 glutamate-ammonia-ligase adenylyltransferase [Frondihabitans sp. PhB188]
MPRSATALTDLARAGFADLRVSRDLLDALIDVEPQVAEFVRALSQSPDPDGGLQRLSRLIERAPEAVGEFLRAESLPSPTASEERPGDRLMLVLGASEGLADFLCRRPASLRSLLRKTWTVPHQDDYERDLLAAVAGLTGDDARTALRVAYREHLVSLTAFDLSLYDPVAGLDVVAAALADLAGAALEAALDVARREVSFPEHEIGRTRLAIIAMGKAGARELNYISDVDVIFVADAADGLDAERAVQIATRLAVHTTRTLSDLAPEEPLWEVDANLRPEGKNGALVRTLASHVAYYERWAKPWEFQALLKARPIAGDLALGGEYVEKLAPMVWRVASTENFVESTQRMRERVLSHIPPAEVDVQLKLGPGGLRDIEFTIQLLQLVHGQGDPDIRQRSTLGALGALAIAGYVGRAEAAEFDRDYRELRLLEHRIQLSRMRRTHLMPRGEDALRVLARATGLAPSAEELREHWHGIRRRVRRLHERLFYRPLLSAVARRPEEELSLSTGSAVARLQAIGFRDPKGALAHIAAMTAGVSRRASIQQHLLPAMLQWFADGTDPDLGLLAFRRLSDGLGETYWFLRMLRDSSGAAQRLTTVLSSSRFVADHLERIPEAAGWLESDDDLRPRTLDELRAEANATVARHEGDDQAAQVLRMARRREILRLALGGIVGVISIDEIGRGLSDIMTAAIGGALDLARRGGRADGLEFAVIALGRYGGQELGFGSDADVLYVYRSLDPADTTAQARAVAIVADLHRRTGDPQMPLDLDAGLRPEGKNGPVVRSLDSYAAYYGRWALTWEAQALLRARGAVGDAGLLADFESLADTVRYPARLSEQDVREVKRLKARVESERLPKAADPTRHLKLGRGSLSDVEWFVQLLQLQNAATTPGLRTPSTLDALAASVEAGLVTVRDADRLRDAWVIASRARSAVMLWTGRTSDSLPADRRQLEAVARLLEYPPNSASQLEEDYLAVTRRARHVFEAGFYGLEKSPEPSV